MSCLKEKTTKNANNGCQAINIKSERVPQFASVEDSLSVTDMWRLHCVLLRLQQRIDVEGRDECRRKGGQRLWDSLHTVTRKSLFNKCLFTSFRFSHQGFGRSC